MLVLEVLCSGLILTGASVLCWSGIRYYHMLAFMRVQIYDRQLFNNWACGMSFIMILLIFAGYIFVASMFTAGAFDSEFLMVSLIFFLGSVVTFCMVNIQQRLIRNLVSKTLETIHSMISAIEAKDIYTKGHSEHVYHLVELIYHRLPGPIKARINLVMLKDAAMLHDIGKIGIPDSILKKPGNLTDEEWQIIRQHPRNGKNILERTSFREICDFVLYHHERVDGKGYYGVSADSIPIESKIIAIADTFSALFASRIYRESYSFNEAVAILRASAGTQLDPLLVEVFCGISEEEINALFFPDTSGVESSYCLYCKPSLSRNSACLRIETRRGVRFSQFVCPRN